jgi:aryl-alcohol dehydrogenase-like predicted oxidoreductase
MDKKKLANTDLLISELGFGGMSLQSQEQKKNIQLLHYAFDNGINFYDTADLYDNGANELLLGKAFKTNRNKIIIATKVGNQVRSDGSGWDWNPSKSYILSAVDQSLQRLQTDYIDLYQLHGGTLEDKMDEVIEAFEILKAQGKIRHYGISSIRPNVIREYVKKASISSVMMQYSVLDRRPEESCLSLIKAHGIGVLARGSLAKGILLDKQAESYLGHQTSDVSKVQELMNKICFTKQDKISLALHFVLTNEAITSAVTGIRTMEQLEELINAYHSKPSDENFEFIRQNITIHKYEQHR